MGADRIAIKDMAGILTPLAAVALIRSLKSQLDVPITLHSHTTTGMGFLNAVVGMLSGVDAIDTAITPFAGGSSHRRSNCCRFLPRNLAWIADWTRG
jgi:pyruvate/oxaloacetate carboxyltransferase